MMQKYLFFYCGWLLGAIAVCGQTKITFHKADYTCILYLEEGKNALDIYLQERELIKNYPLEVTINDEAEEGQKIVDALKRENGILSVQEDAFKVYQAKAQMIERILWSIQRVYDWRFKKYTLYYLQSDIPNAFTFGGYIFITSALLDLIEDENQWAFVLAHEVGHNELKHINYNIKRRRGFGGLGELLLAAQQSFAPSFNQFQEWECDVFACDVLKALNYELSEAITFFQILEKNTSNSKSENSVLDKLLSSHPLHSERYECLKKHIEKNNLLNNQNKKG